MCGICGEIRFDGRSADVAAVTRMTGAMVSRGPDFDGVVAHGPIALGHRRLSIIDLSARGAQPMVDSDLGLTLVFNGCIYNYRDLRKELEDVGYHFFSSCRQRSGDQGLPPVGNRLRGPLQGHVRIRDRRPRNRRGHTRARSARHQTAVSGRNTGTAAVRVDGACAARRRRRRHRTRPPRAASLHELSLSGACSAHHLPRRAQAAACDRAGDPARRLTRRHGVLDTGVRARPGAGVLDRRATGRTR